MFFQSHLENCDSCRQSLARSRAIYYAVDALISRGAMDESALDYLEAAQRQAQFLRGSEFLSFRHSIATFILNRDVQFMLFRVYFEYRVPVRIRINSVPD